MRIKRHPEYDLPTSEITPESVYRSRREWLRLAALAPALSLRPEVALAAPSTPLSFRSSRGRLPEGFDTADSLTPESDAKRYNNFYEFGPNKDDPAAQAHRLTTSPWQIRIDGQVDRPYTLDVQDLLAHPALEERVYRLRCVEAWSMVIPWVGIPLSLLLEQALPKTQARYVAFQSVLRPQELPGQRSRTSLIEWPYREGLRLDEAMHPLTLLAVGMYGKVLPAQNGAPVRLVVPWKYGFKSIKSIVSIELSEQQPTTTWQSLAPQEYGFYANVNPDVDHPRWSQRYERRLPSTLFSPNRIATQPFNGYAEQVASLYLGMDLRRHY